MISQKEHEKVLLEFRVQNKQLAERVHELEHILDQDSRQAVIESLHVENLRCREALEFYAKEDNYDYWEDIREGELYEHDPIAKDRGKRARKELEESE